MTTVSLQIGNGDGKLSQSQWHQFVVEMKRLVERHSAKVHFFGAPENWREQQNVAFIFDIEAASIENLEAKVTKLRKRFGQESAAWTEGDTRFI
jgi:N-acyl-L-homoserine lactone synthetase